MMLTLAAATILLVSLLLVLGNLRMIAHDTLGVLVDCAIQARNDGDLAPRLAFVALWALIFALSYL